MIVVCSLIFVLSIRPSFSEISLVISCTLGRRASGFRASVSHFFIILKGCSTQFVLHHGAPAAPSVSTKLRDLVANRGLVLTIVELIVRSKRLVLPLVQLDLIITKPIRKVLISLFSLKLKMVDSLNQLVFVADLKNKR